ncbi:MULTISPECIES: chemotaxis protein CheW [unclassified Mucilaginibacter]|jgi:purine-binding chemotaxis protein CheW|uniref:chemotaxis protein CheW n=1 Tax=unclassified Mucilaginibacter TaxID=2617802 RepID=UPI0008D36892|nr:MULTISPECIES: chemotaxis protein CheW [unclassified Mucilaginibacter]WDF78572.1 chemotaxis protein CheW [Mucilaginibacter sp. KACC 22773]SEO20924.1 CheW protein [Mucilaginibacter sp. OK283]
MSIKLQTQSYLTFKLQNELFAINVGDVLEILEMSPITKVPKSPAFMKGVINLRGNILPVMDARNKFAMPDAEFTIDTCIVVLNIDSGKEPLLVGAIVDSVQKVIDIPDEDIQVSASMGAMYREDFITGIGKVEDNFVMILNIDKVFSADDVYAITES